jgi:hypothetical protein
MSGHADTIRQALQGAMVGKWGRENALRSLAEMEDANRQLRNALGESLDWHTLARTPNNDLIAYWRSIYDGTPSEDT